MNIRLGRKLLNSALDVCGFGAVCVVRIRRSVNDGVLWLTCSKRLGWRLRLACGFSRTHYESRGNCQLPTAIAIYKRQVNEDTPIDFLLVLRHLVDQPEMTRNLISCVA